MRQAILVNGVPASGKSTVAARLVDYLIKNGIPAVPLSLDTVKECLYAHVGIGDRDHNRMLGRASYQSIFASIAAFPDNLIPVIDAWHGFQPASVVRDHLTGARIDIALEIWCIVSPAVAAERYRSRADLRSAGHPPASYADELYELARRSRPLALGPTVEVNTENIVDEREFEKVLRRLTCGRS